MDVRKCDDSVHFGENWTALNGNKGKVLQQRSTLMNSISAAESDIKQHFNPQYKASFGH